MEPSPVLDLIHRLARRLLPLRPVLVGLAAGASLGAAIGLFALAGDDGDAVLMPSLILLLWLVTGLVFIDVFAHIPQPPRAGDQARGRLASKLWRLAYWALVLGFAALGLTAADLSLHMADAWLVDHGE